MLIEIDLPKLHPAQRQVMDEAERFNVLVCGRRWGKSVLGIFLLIHVAALGKPVAWFSPTYKMLIDAWEQTLKMIHPLIKRTNKQERRIELLTGGVIEFWSLDKPDVARGRKYALIFVDESAMIAKLKDAWINVLRPTLADYEGVAWFASTPKGFNYFYELYSMMADGWRAWRFPTATNPHIKQSEIDAMRDQMPERSYSQEILAQFVDAGGGIFRNVSKLATVEPEQERGDSDYVVGVDWGKSNDFTVFTVVNAQTNEVVHIDRFNQIDYNLQLSRLKALDGRFKPLSIVAEVNAMGEPLVEALEREGLPVIRFHTSNASKKQIIEDLSLAFEREEIGIIPDENLMGELMSFEAVKLPSGAYRYTAPSGAHDDCVMSLALAWSEVGGKSRNWLIW
jgi:phage terminase large subunit-like protein